MRYRLVGVGAIRILFQRTLKLFHRALQFPLAHVLDAELGVVERGVVIARLVRLRVVGRGNASRKRQQHSEYP